MVMEDYQVFYLHLLAAHLNLAKDPDTRVLIKKKHSYLAGVPIGVGVDLPRTPAAFERKTHWRAYDDEDVEGEPAVPRTTLRSIKSSLRLSRLRA